MCQPTDYIINCDTKNVTLDNVFCKESNIPKIEEICKVECPVGYIRENGECKGCPQNL
jgi:hypothetical protein